MRTLDDRIGISHEELRARPAVPLPALPASRRPAGRQAEHRSRAAGRMPADNRWGFRMPVPELLYNKGELYNLSSSRGTLSAEERYKINEHIVQT
jgi:hypothetical protein